MSDEPGESWEWHIVTASAEEIQGCHAVLEGCADAVALRDNWETYLTVTHELGIPYGVSPTVERFPVAVVAESSYGVGGRHLANWVTTCRVRRGQISDRF